jgi:protein-tyrosine-phosphatase
MAEAFLLQTDQSMEVILWGINPHYQVDLMTVKVMGEIGIDFSNKKPKSLTLFEGIQIDYLITLVTIQEIKYYLPPFCSDIKLIWKLAIQEKRLPQRRKTFKFILKPVMKSGMNSIISIQGF